MSTEFYAYFANIFQKNCGLRLMECMRLRIKDIDFESTTVTIHSGKGDKDRIVMLPKNIKPDLKEHISLCKDQYLADKRNCRRQCGEIFDFPFIHC